MKERKGIKPREVEKAAPNTFCECCGKRLRKVAWLSLDQRTDTYHDEDVPAEFSQGGFPFGTQCASRKLGQHFALIHND